MTIAEQLEQKGIEKGERGAICKIAQVMLQKGMDYKAIMEMTGLSEDELVRLLRPN